MRKLPDNFLDRARKFSGDEYTSFIESLSQIPPVSIRINPYKREGVFSTVKKIPWSEEGRYLPERPSFTLDPLFHAGCYYVQDASSQFLEKAFLQAKEVLNKPLRILDLCAAPGGKSTHILSLIENTDILVCNEVVASRNSILRQNIMKWGKDNVIVTQNDPSDFSRLEGFFDIVLVDAPCSGEGLFRKDENAIDEWSEENVNNCVIRQKEILKHAIATLKYGGFLIYSTCTFEEDENDKQIDQLCENNEMCMIKIANQNTDILESRNGKIFLPHRIRGEGFYISLLQKSEGENNPLKKTGDKLDSSNKKHLVRFLENADDFTAILKDDRLFAIKHSMQNTFNSLSRNLYVRLAGIYMGDFKGEDFIPSPALALSCNLKNDLITRELNLNEAVDYLRGNLLLIDVPKGWATVNYKNFKLGWIKNVGTRINNYYPKEWRIRKNS